MPLLESIDQTNPYAQVQIDKRDLCVLQQRIKWDNGVWSENDQIAMRKRVMHCCVRKEAHWDMALWSDSYSKYVNLPKLLLSSVLGTSLVVDLVGGSSGETFTYFNAVCSVFLTFLTALTTFYSFEERKIAHRLTSLAYGRLIAEMERMTQTAPEDRDNFGNTLADLNNKYSAIRDDAPFLDKDLLIRYVELFGQNTEDLYSVHVSGVDEEPCIEESVSHSESPDVFSRESSIVLEDLPSSSRHCSDCLSGDVLRSKAIE